MCDTVVAVGDATADGVTLFGKNSDREPNEAHHLLRVPRVTHAPGSMVKCTYIEIPQVAETCEVLLAKPFWIWGAEMGTNEYGVTIGNEAVFTKIPYEKGPGLIGMDFIRLALERATTARAALDVMTTLLEEHGQGGNCGFELKSYYHNSFIIADPHDAWVLETAGRQWAAEHVTGIRTISNAITIGNEWDLASDDLVSFAVDKGWCKGRDDFHFGRCYSDFLYTRFSNAAGRQSCTTNILHRNEGQLTPEHVMAALRSHGLDASLDAPTHNFFSGVEVCAHAGLGPVRQGQSTGSMVSHLAPDVQMHFLTGTSAPCTSIFKPYWMGAELPLTGPQPTGTYDAATLYWRHESLHRETLRNYPANIALYQLERDALEAEFMAGARKLAGASPDERAAFAQGCFEKAAAAEDEWTRCVQEANHGAKQGPLYALAWRSFNKSAGMPSV